MILLVGQAKRSKNSRAKRNSLGSSPPWALMPSLVMLKGPLITSPLVDPITTPLFTCLPTAYRADFSSRFDLPLTPNSLLISSGGRTRTRTLDPLIKSQLLYQLSYAPGCRASAQAGRAVAKPNIGVQNGLCTTKHAALWSRPTRGAARLNA